MKKFVGFIAASLLTANAVAAIPQGWRHGWGQGQNEWGWGDWNGAAPTGFVISCPDQAGNGDFNVSATVRGVPVKHIEVNNHSYVLSSLTDSTLGDLWRDIRTGNPVTISNESGKVSFRSTNTQQVIPAKVCGGFLH